MVTEVFYRKGERQGSVLEPGPDGDDMSVTSTYWGIVVFGL